VGGTEGGRAEAVGDALTLMAPEEEEVIRSAELALGKSIPPLTLSDFPYHVIAHPNVVLGGNHRYLGRTPLRQRR